MFPFKVDAIFRGDARCDGDSEISAVCEGLWRGYAFRRYQHRKGAQQGKLGPSLL